MNPDRREDQRAQGGSSQVDGAQRVTWNITAPPVEGGVLSWRVECESQTPPQVTGLSASVTRVEADGDHRWLLSGMSPDAGTGVQLHVRVANGG